MQVAVKSKAPQAFFLALLTGALIFVPFLIYDHGYFIYYGDFNVQQIPFYQLAHEAVRSGDLFWSWYTDLGANFIGSYSFYLLFSPFFWLTLPFPTAWLPYMMAPLLVLKTACASLTAYLYLRRFVRDPSYAVLGGLLYAFSGWMAFNIFFNHFHEVAVFFPLLLLGLELLVTENRRGLFAVAVAVNAVVNYWFFVGEVVFVILYVFVRMTDKQWGMNLRRFCLVALEAVLGFACAAAVVLPSVLAIMGNPRTGADEILSGWNAWLYWHEQRPPAILQSLFFPPELPARPNFLPDHGAKWASLSGWLPLFSVVGVLAYFFQRNNDWLKKLLALSLVFALVPWLNALFVLLNDSYYARWFYMPVLLMALATARALEDCRNPATGEIDTAPFARAVKWTALVVITYTVMSGLTPHRGEDGWEFGLAKKPEIMWIFSAIAMSCLLLAALLTIRLRKSPRFRHYAIVGVMLVSVGFTVFYISNGKRDREASQWIIDHAINGREQVSLPEDGVFSRVDVYEGSDNIAMYWHLPNIQAFHSIVPPSIMEFYPAVGVTRDVGSRPEAKYFALRPLLSVRWLFIEEDNNNQDPMPGYHYYDSQNGFCIYENENFLPMGFAYDQYLTELQLEDIATEHRSNVMLRALVLDNQTINRNLDILDPLPQEGFETFDVAAMQADVQARREHTAAGFAFDTTGFTVTTNFTRSKMLFLSVPWDEGWSATSGRENVRIEKANIGFMAVRVPPGQQVIRFTYTTPGLKAGLVVTAGSLLILAGYLLLCGRRHAGPALPQDPREAIRQGQTVHLSWEEYMALVGDKEERAAALQQTLNENAAKAIREELPEDDRTLLFRPEPEEGPGAEPAPAPPEQDLPNSPGALGNARDSAAADAPDPPPQPPEHPEQEE